MTKNKIQFNIINGENYWNKYEEYIQLYNNPNITVKEIFKKLKISNRRFNNYHKKAIKENRITNRREQKK